MKTKKHRLILLSSLITGLLSTQTAFGMEVSSCEANYITPPQIAGRIATGTSGADNLTGSNGSDVILSGGLSQGVESVEGNGGADYLVFRDGDNVASNNAGNDNGHIRIRDFIIDDTRINFEADSIALGNLIGEENLNATTISDYIHIVSGLFGWGTTRSAIYINLEGDFTSADRQALDDGAGSAVGNGADLYLEFQAEQGNNNFEEITGHEDNSVAQLQALIDMGFLKLSANDIFGSTGNDQLEGTSANERFFPRGAFESAKSIRGNGGADHIVFQKDALLSLNVAGPLSGGHYRIRDFTIGDILLNPEADSVSLGDFIGQINLNANNIGNHLHIISGLFGNSRTGVYVNIDGDFSAENRDAIASNPSLGGHGADLFLEFQGQLDDNNFEILTGYADNSAGQIQTLIDWGFFDFTTTTSSGIPCVQGLQGETGPQGPEGEVGPQGSIGLTGATGTTGLQGPQGEIGPEGPIGLTGSQGEAGAQGPQGEVGPAGPQGEVGPKGSTGLTGAQGPKGNTGAQGPQGASGTSRLGPNNATCTASIAGTLRFMSNSSLVTVIQVCANIFTSGSTGRSYHWTNVWRNARDPN
jgi:hypothetical protein